ncbi:hypothetical protein NDU88_010089 [Pleurodeles waltl]|uniref:Uncharacterized protein n=1 Tax=Pleurodeles waltl TaxID=8319 RepID=A0AAV7PWY5_PLEWA|nr:hypothetical protein NDU88_010089 [Pleurodeles waltl]
MWIRRKRPFQSLQLFLMCTNIVLQLTTYPCVKMTDWVPFEEEEYGRYDEDGQFLGDGLSEAINASVQQSVNKALEVSVPQQISQALLVVLKPFTQQL